MRESERERERERVREMEERERERERERLIMKNTIFPYLCTEVILCI